MKNSSKTKDQLAKFGTSHGPVASYMQMFNIMQYVTYLYLKACKTRRARLK